MKKNLAILGSTGSIGTQALDVVRSHPALFGIEVLTAQTNCDLLIRQAIEFIPNAVVIGNTACYSKVAEALKPYPVKVFTGHESIAQIVEMDRIDLVLSALVGYVRPWRFRQWLRTWHIDNHNRRVAPHTSNSNAMSDSAYVSLEANTHC